MPAMTEQDRTKNNHLIELMDSMFKFKPGDLVVQKIELERIKAEFDLNRYTLKAGYGAALAVTQPMSVVERVLKECPGNFQCFYAVNSYTKRDDGLQVVSPILFIDNAVVSWEEAKEFYAAYRAKADAELGK